MRCGGDGGDDEGGDDEGGGEEEEEEEWVGDGWRVNEVAGKIVAVLGAD